MDLGKGPHVCGNDVVDPGEQCDDGNLLDGDGCDEACSSEPFAWVYDPPFERGITGRFNAIALVGDHIVAAGRYEDEGTGDQLIHLVAADPAGGGLLDELKVESGSGIRAEAHGLAVRDEEIYFGMLGTPPMPVVLEFDSDGDEQWIVWLPEKDAAMSGYARAVAVRDLRRWRVANDPGR